ncbi:MAG TPA: type IX secretion system protein PorQ [Bacteroidota bacterium]|nr:type IX secretion system protein PorQ [Bacteroidota bacterium]
MRGIFARASLLALGLSIAAADPLQAQTTTVYSFLRNDVDARSAALAGSVVSLTDDPSLLFYNPASLATLDLSRGSAGFFKHLLDINSGYAVYGQSIGDLGHAGMGIVYTNYGSFDQTDDLGNTIGTFTASDLALSLGYGGTLDENLYWGAAAKFIFSSIAGYHSTGLAGDLGLLYLIPGSKITLGASVRNMGTQLSTYAGLHEPLPVDLTVGGSIVPRGIPLLLNINLHRLNESADTFGDRFRAFTIGGEFTLSRVFVLRVGYDNQARKDLQTGPSAGLAGFSAGVGITVSATRVDYALSSYGAIGSLHRISVSSSF